MGVYLEKSVKSDGNLLDSDPKELCATDTSLFIMPLCLFQTQTLFAYISALLMTLDSGYRDENERRIFTSFRLIHF